MKNCVQTLIVTGADPDDLQENLNARLLPLGKNVKTVEVISLNTESVAVVTYETYNPTLEMEQKIGALEKEVNHDPIDPIRVLVMFGSEYELAAKHLENYKKRLENSLENFPHYVVDIEELESLINRFNNDSANSQGD